MEITELMAVDTHGKDPVGGVVDHVIGIIAIQEVQLFMAEKSEFDVRKLKMLTCWHHHI